MTSGGLRVGRLLGVPIAIHPLWIAIVALLTWSLGAEWFPSRVHHLSPVAGYLLGLASALLLFACILAHELGHAVVARRRGVQVDEIDLWLLGGVSRMHGEPRRPDDELAFALAGPAVTAAIVAVCGAARVLVGGGHSWPIALLDYQLVVNALVLGFNLLPAFPLDGGRVLRALLWRAGGDRLRATVRAASIGQTFALLLGALGILGVASGAPGGLWFVAIAVFLWVAGRAEAAGLRWQLALGGRTAGDVAVPAICIAADTSIAEAIDDSFARHLYTAYPVLSASGEVLGLLSIDRVRAVPPSDRPWRTAGELADRDAALVVAPETPVVEVIGRPAFQRVGRAVVTGGPGGPVGLLSRTDVERLVRVEDVRSRPPADLTPGRR